MRQAAGRKGQRVKRALVLGGYGLIGLECLRALRAAGFQVTGLGRLAAAAQTADPGGDWIIRDIATLTVDQWREMLTGVDVLVNAAGALQAGGRDDLTAIHVTAIDRLTRAAAGLPLRIVQISAAGVSPRASTAFFRTKAQGDAILAERVENRVILRPVLVLAPQAYGGTALLRAAAAMPLVLPVMMPGAQVQTVHVADVAAAVVAAAEGRVPSGTCADLTEPGRQSFSSLLAAIRRWQGFAPPIWRPRLPDWLLAGVGRGADLLGHLGWRSPMRTTAIRALRDGVTGDPAAWQAAGGAPCRPLVETLASLPATRAERLYARMFLAVPAAIAMLSGFWIASGAITLANPARALAELDAALPRGMAAVAVYGGALADLALGAGILWRRWTRPAALGMIGLSAAYLAGATVLTPDLWADPLGPMVKVLPAMMLAALVWLAMEDR